MIELSTKAKKLYKAFGKKEGEVLKALAKKHKIKVSDEVSMVELISLYGTSS